jgi:excisionase family DNA binding protein
MASSPFVPLTLPGLSWAATIPVEEIPAALTQLAALQTALAARLAAAHRSERETELLDAREIADVLGVPESHIRTMQRAGKLPHTKIGKYIRFDLAAVQAALRGAGE